MSIRLAALLTVLILALANQARAQSIPASPPAAPATPAGSPAPAPSVADVFARAQLETQARLAEVEMLAADAHKEVAAIDEGDKLRTPDSPAFTLLGVSPTDIAKPTTPRALAVALSKFVTSDAAIELPQNVAVEVAPFWLWPRDRLTYADFVKNDRAQWLRNFSLSLATTAADMSGAIGLAAGARTHYGFDSGSIDTCAKYDAELNKLAQLAAVGAKNTADLRAAHTRTGVTDEAAFQADLAKLKATRAATIEKATKDLAEDLVDCAEAGAARKRTLSLAAALSWRFPSAEAKNGDLTSQAYWATYARRWDSWTLLVLGRLRFDEADRGWDGFLDLGGRAIYSHERNAVAAELITRRHVFGTDSDEAYTNFRFALQFEHMINKGTWLSVSFGKDFGPGTEGAFFSLANLTTSFGDPTIVH